MKEGWRATDTVIFRKKHAVTDRVTVVQDGAMRQAGGFWSRGRTRGELDVGELIRVEILVGQRGAGRREDDVFIRRRSSQFSRVNTATRVIDEDDLAKGGQDVRL